MLFSMFPIILRVTVIYFIILIGIRCTGKREIGQMSPFDLVLLLLISNAVQNAMLGPDVSLVGGIVAACTLFLWNAVIARLTFMVPRFRHLIEGSPTLLIHNGKILENNLKKEGLTHEIIEEALREHGVDSTRDVKVGILEVDGSVSIVRVSDASTAHIPHHHFRILRKK